MSNADWKFLLGDLEELYKEWQRKKRVKKKRERHRWERAVLFGIEIARERVEEEIVSSRIDLDALLRSWKGLRKRERVGAAAESLNGIDFGVQLVMRRIRRYLRRPVQPKPPKSMPAPRKPPTSANGRMPERKSRRGYHG